MVRFYSIEVLKYQQNIIMPDLFTKITGNKLIAFGYGGRTSVGRLQKIQQAYNAIIVDTRWQAHSRNEFDQDNLRKLCGTNYKHAKSLGNINYQAGVTKDIVLADPAKGIPVLAKLLQQHNIILMCVCRKLAFGCHRNEIIRLLRERGEKFELLEDGEPKTKTY